ncbi:MAG: HEAT repeat domain-containing protein [Gemmataceae bacterium]
MHALAALVLLLPTAATDLDLGQLRELLYDRLDPRGQSQAALLLVQSRDPAAEKLVRQGLRQAENEEAFQALATAVRLRQDARFLGELLAALVANRPRIRQVVAETLAGLASPDVVRRLTAVASDPKADLRVRQTALWTLGRTGRQAAAAALIAQLDAPEDLRRVAMTALADLTGQSHGTDAERWKSWWDRHKGMTHEQWLEMRLAFHTTRALRLEGDLLRYRAQVNRLHQMLYSRLPLAERFSYLQALRDHEDPGVRALAVVFAVELRPAVTDVLRVAVLSEIVVHLTHDTNQDVQRGAVLALGRFNDAKASDRLRELLAAPTGVVRAAATRALATQARGSTAEARALQKEAIPLLQKALDDKSLEVVVEAAEALGTLGATEAGPVLTDLLRHGAENVRQTAAQALERTADVSLIDGLLKGLDDVAGPVRFSLVGAIGKAFAGAATVPDGLRARLLARLEKVMATDEDVAVRARAATVLGECGGPEQLGLLWKGVQSGTEGRVQEKAWDAMLDVLGRAASLKLVETWDAELTKLKQTGRRVQMWGRVYARWEQRADQREIATQALEGLVGAQIDDGKYQAAAPLGQTLLARCSEGGEAARGRCLKLLLRVAQAALADGNRGEALRIVTEVRGYLTAGPMSDAFEAVRAKAARE